MACEELTIEGNLLSFQRRSDGSVAISFKGMPYEYIVSGDKVGVLLEDFEFAIQHMGV